MNESLALMSTGASAVTAWMAGDLAAVRAMLRDPDRRTRTLAGLLTLADAAIAGTDPSGEPLDAQFARFIAEAALDVIANGWEPPHC